MEQGLVTYIKKMFEMTATPVWTSEYEGVIFYDKTAHRWVTGRSDGWEVIDRETTTVDQVVPINWVDPFEYPTTALLENNYLSDCSIITETAVYVQDVKSVIIDIADNWGGTTGIGIRRVEFYNETNTLIPLTTDFIAYATSNYATSGTINYYPNKTFDTSLSKTGGSDNQWLSLANSITSQRLICIFNKTYSISKIVVNNHHNTGASTNAGAKNIKIYTSPDVVSDVTYAASVLNYTKIFDGQLAQHAASDIVDDQILTLNFPTVYKKSLTVTNNLEEVTTTQTVLENIKSVVLDIENGYGNTSYIGIRRIEFYDDTDTLISISDTDITAYATSIYSTEVFKPSMAFNTTLSKIGIFHSTQWLSSVVTNQRLICVFNVPKNISKIVMNNGHSSGSSIDTSVRAINIYTSTVAITNTTYASELQSLTLISQCTPKPHVPFDIIDDQIIQINFPSATSLVANSNHTYGDYAMKCIAINNVSENQKIYREFDPPVDISTEQLLNFDVKSSKIGQNLACTLNDTLPRYIALTVPHESIGEDLIEFPLLINLSADSGITDFDCGDIFDELGDNKYKIRLVDSTNNRCYIEIESWDSINKKAILHAKVNLSSTVDSVFKLYYNNQFSDDSIYVGVTGSTTAQKVWDSNFKAVYTMAQDPSIGGACIIDSTINVNHGTPYNMTSSNLVDGLVSKALNFDGSNDYIDIPNSPNLSARTGTFTIEGLFNLRGINSHTIYSDYGSVTTANAQHFIITNGKIEFVYRGNSQDIRMVTASCSINQYCNAASIRKTLGIGTAWLNGVQVETSTNNSVNDIIVSTGANPNIGRLPQYNESFFNGIIESVRISNIARSDAWIKATNYSLRDNLIEITNKNNINTYDINIDHTKIDSILYNFPVLLCLTSDLLTYDENKLLFTDNIEKDDEFIGLDTELPNTERWINSVSNPVKIYNNKAKFSCSSTIGSSTLTYKGILTGDFSVEIGYEGINTPATNYYGLFLILYNKNNNSSNNAIQIYKGFTDQHGGQSYQFVGTTQTNTAYKTDFAANGKLKVERVGSTTYTYYINTSGVWTLSSTSNNTISLADVKIELALHYWIGIPTVDFYITHFKINSGVVYWPQSSFPGWKNLQITAYDDNNEIVSCPTEVESFNTYFKKIILHTKVPIIYVDKDTILKLNFIDNNDDIGRTGEAAAQQVWDSNFKAVYTMAQNPGIGGACILDSTINANHGTPYGMTSANLVDGLVSKALDFDGSNDYVSIGDVLDLGLNDITISMLISFDSLSGLIGIFGKSRYGSNMGRYYLTIDNNNLYMGFEYATNLISFASVPISSLSINTDYHIVGVIDRDGKIMLYINGVLRSEAIIGGGNATSYNTSDITGFGAYQNETGNVLDRGYFDGKMEHIAVLFTSCSDAWIKATNYSLRNELLTFSIATTSLAHPISIATANTFQTETIDISSIGSIKNIAWTITNDDLDNTFYIDKMYLGYFPEYKKWIDTFEYPTNESLLANYSSNINTNVLTITVDHTKIDEDLVDFPLLINLNFYNADKLFNTLGSNKLCMELVDIDDHQKYVEIETWDHINKKAILHAKVDLSSTTDSVFKLIYGINEADRPISGYQSNDGGTFLLLSDTVDGSTTFIDSSTNAYPIAITGTVIHQTAQTKLAASSIYFTAGSALTTTSSVIAFGTSDFTIHVWFRPTSKISSYPRILNNSLDTWVANDWILCDKNNDYPTKFLFQSFSGMLLTSTTESTNGTWYHIAVTRKNNYVRMFINGIKEAEISTTASLDGNVPHKVGIGSSGSTRYLNGHVDGVSIVVGECLWESNFTPPTTTAFYLQPYPIYYIGLTGSKEAINVWDSNFKAVYTMAQDPSIGGACILDSTVNANHGTPSGLVAGDLVDTIYGKAIFMSGANYISVPHSNSLLFSNAFTIDFFGFVNISGECSLVIKGNNNGSLCYGLGKNTSNYYYSWSDNDGTWGPTRSSSLTSVYTANQYYQLTTKLDNNVQKIYQDGSLEAASSAITGNIYQSTTAMLIGKHPVWTNSQNGNIVSIRISNVARSDAWIKATNYSLRDALASITPSSIGSLETTTDYYTYGSRALKLNMPALRSLGTYLTRTININDITQQALKFDIKSFRAGENLELQIEPNISMQYSIVIDQSYIDEDLINFPLTIVLTNMDLFNLIGNNYQKLKIEYNNTQCYIEVETWDSANYKAVLHVKVPFISSTVDTELLLTISSIYEYTSHIGVTGSSPAQQVWDTNFKAVYTMAQNPATGGACILDSTVNANHGTPYGSMTSGQLVDGLTGKAISFDGVDDYIVVNNTSNWFVGSNYTYEALFNATAVYTHPTTPIWTSSMVLSSYRSTPLGGFYLGINYTYNYFANNTTQQVASSQQVTLGDYKYASIVNSSNMSSITLDNTAKTTGALNTPQAVGESVCIGSLRLSNTDYLFIGKIEHIRISNIARSSAWIKATNYSLRDQLITITKVTSSITKVTSSTIQHSVNIMIPNKFQTEIIDISTIDNIQKITFKIINDDVENTIYIDKMYLE